MVQSRQEISGCTLGLTFPEVSLPELCSYRELLCYPSIAYSCHLVHAQQFGEFVFGSRVMKTFTCKRGHLSLAPIYPSQNSSLHFDSSRAGSLAPLAGLALLNEVVKGPQLRRFGKIACCSSNRAAVNLCRCQGSTGSA